MSRSRLSSNSLISRLATRFAAAALLGMASASAFAAPGMSVSGSTGVEGNVGTTDFTFEVTLSEASDRRVLVKYHTISAATDTAMAGEDYVAVTGELAFEPGETLKTFTVSVNGDTKHEAEERFSVGLYEAVRATLTKPTGKGVITNDDVVPGLSVSGATGAEGDAGTTDFTFEVTLSEASGKPVTVKYHTISAGTDTATAGEDYAEVSGELAFGPGETVKTFTVPVIGDRIYEAAERFTVGLYEQTRATLSRPTGKGLIAESDADTLLRVGAAKRSVKPSDAHIAGVTESRIGGTERTQKFNLGGFGINPTQSMPNPADMAGEQLTQPAEIAAFNGSRGEEPIQLRALVIEQPNGETVVFMTLDAIGAGNIIQDGVKAAVTAATGVPAANILFGQTHSHAGPDLQGLWGGVPEDWVQNTLYVAAGEAAAEAFAARQPARLRLSQGHTVEFNNYRRPRIDPNADADGTLTLLKAVTADGAVIGSILQYNAHPTSIDENPRSVHADYIQGAMDWIEGEVGGVGLYYNGPIADASGSGERQNCVRAPGDGNYGNVRCRGEGIAEAALALTERELAPTLAADEREVILPITNPGFLAFGAIGSFNRYYNFMQQVPVDTIPGVGPEARNLPQLTPTATTLVSRITIGGADGGLEIVTIPGETTNTMGDYIRGLAKTNVMLLGLTHNSFGYILPEEEFSYVDQEGDDGLVAPFTGYEENVSLGPLTAPLLRTQGYNPLFGTAPEADVPPTISACFDDRESATCVLQVIENRLNVLVASVSSCVEGGLGAPGCPLRTALDMTIGAIAEGCRDFDGPEAFCGVFDAITGTGAGEAIPSLDATLVDNAALAQAAGCDILDPSACLLPFPSDHFTVAAAPRSIQDKPLGTGRRVDFNVLAMPRNIEGKPIDPTEWNRNDGFSPGQQIITYVPDVATVKDAQGNPTGPIVGAPPITDIGQSLDVANASVVVLDADTGLPHPVWVEIDLNAGYLLPADKIDNPDPTKPAKPALIVRPASNFLEGHRYVVVLKNLKDDVNGLTLPAGNAFRACRDELPTQLPPVQSRCDHLAANVFPVLAEAGITVKGNRGLYLAWDFTVASAQNNVARLRHMRDDAFVNYLGQVEDADGSIVNLGRAPGFKVTQVSDSGGERTVQGSFTIPSYVVPVDPSPLEQERDVRQQLKEQFPQFAAALDAFNSVPRQAYTVSAPPNRLFYNPADAPNPDDPQGQRYGDGLPDRTGEMTATFTCRLPRNASAATRPIVYGHGLLGGQEERGADHDYDMMYCKADWFGFAFGDIPNVVSALGDMSNFPVIPDGSQQGMLNQLFLTRLLRHPQGFIADPAFKDANGQPLFDNREVFYDGNSQGGILGGVVVALSKDITRGVLGVVGMNYSTLLQRSVDYDGQLAVGIPPYSLPTYLSYQDDLDRQLVFSIIQMLWDRSENNGYAHHITDNAVLKGPDKQVLLHPAFADHQVTMWSAQVMARTIGVDLADMYQRKPGEGATYTFPTKWDFFEQRDPDTAHFWDLPLVGRNAGVSYDSADCAGTDCRTLRSAFVEFDEGRTAIPPIGNVPPRADDFDPHGYPRGTIFGRCQKSHFLHTQGRLIDVRGERNVTSAANCPALPQAVTPPPVPVGGDAGVPPFPFNPCAPAGTPGIEGECLLDVPVLGELLETAWNFINDPGEVPPGGGGGVPGAGPIEQIVADATANAQTLPADLQASVEQTVANAQNGTLADRSAEVVVMEGKSFPDWSQPAAFGISKPYPYGVGGDGDPVTEPFDEYIGNNLPTGPLRTRDAHNGVMLYPPAGVPFEGLPTAAPVGDIAAFKYVGGAWNEIPVQVDERFPYFLANANSGFSFYSGTDTELTYAWDSENWKATGECTVDPSSVDAMPDPVPGLDDDDEIAFMASDAGEQAPSGAAPENAAGGQEIALADPLNPGVTKFVYLFRRVGGTSYDGAHYVQYTRDDNADQWVDRSFWADNDPEKVGTSNTGYGPNLSGTVCRDGVTPQPSNDRFPRDGMTVSTDKYQVYASGRWMVRNVQIAKPGEGNEGNYGADIVDRWKGRAFQQSPDSVVSLVGFEDEQVNWEANSALLGERVGPIRAIREIWGADSGTNVTKTETYYRDAYVYRFHARVHPIPPDGLYTSWDYNRGAMVPAPGENVPGGRYYTAVRGTGVPIDGRNDDVGQIDQVEPVAGYCITSDGPQPAEDFGGVCPLFFDTGDPALNLPLTMYNWEQIAAKGDLGSLVYLFELKSPTIGANSVAMPYYRDDACLDDGTGDDPVARPWPGEAYRWNNGAVPKAYDQRAGRALDHSGKTFADCVERQGAHAQHGIHFFAPPESDNAMMPVPVDEIDGQQWAFAVPMGEPTNVGEQYANIVRAPLVKVARPLPAGGGTPGGQTLPDYDTCVAMAQEGGAADHEAAAKFACAVIFGGGRDEGEAGEDEIQGPNTYVAMDDGTLIATNVYVPWNCNVAKNPDAKPCASILEMSGYESGSDEGQTPAGDVDDIIYEETGQRGMPLTGGTRASHEKYYKSEDRYVSITASVRGTGCSAGEFDLFSRKSAYDGYQLVEWMAAQPWSNGKVGIFGHSYSGITGAMIASTNPPHLAMVTISGQVGDVYRDITYPGGVSNYGFPLLWTGGVRPAYDYLGGTFAGLISDSSDRQCAQNQAARSRAVQDDPLIQGLAETDTPWMQERSVVNYLYNVKAPTHVTTAYQDEQTGPRGGTHVFDKLPQNLTRRLVTLNGDHGSQTGPAEVTFDRRYWMDYFMLDANDPNPDRRPRAWGSSTETPPATPPALPAPVFAHDGTATSRVLLEVNSGARSNGHIDSTGFPLAQTQWTDFYFRGDHTLTLDTPTPDEASASSTWFNGSKRQFYSYQAGVTTGSQLSTADASGADELIFALDVDSVAEPYGTNDDTAFVIAGPIMADLYITSRAPDTELMVQLIDADPTTGERLYLQRGVLRASHRAIESQHSQCATYPAGGRKAGECTLLDNIYRPHRPHDSSTNLIVPGQITRYALEIFPVGHVFRAGHQLLVKVHAPSLDDNDWAYISRTAPTLNTLHHSAEYASSIRLPVIPVAAVSRLGGPTATCSDDSMRCIVAGADPSGDYRSQCHEYAADDPTGIGEMLCSGFDTLAGLIFGEGGGGEPGPGTQVGDATGQAFDAVAEGSDDAIGGDLLPGAGGSVLAGVGVVDMTPDVGYGAGQYSDSDPARHGVDPYATAKKQAKSYGVMSRLTGRAIVVEGSNGKRIALLKSDNYLAQDNLIRRIAQILAENNSTIGYDQILYGVTHAHSTSYYSTPSWGVWAFQDAFDARFFEFQARKLASAILIAEADLRPARMGATTVRHKVFKGQIMGPSTGDDGTPVQYPNEYGDLGLVVMRFDEVNEVGDVVGPIAAWINWGEHPEGLDGYDLHSADFVAFLERFVDRDLGVPMVYSQGDVGSAEKSGNTSQRIRDDGTVCQGTSAEGPACAEGEGVWRDWNHAGYVQNERNVRFLADAVVKGWKVIGGELPVDMPVTGILPNNYVPAVQVPPSTTFPVDYRNAFVPGPLSHPYPSVSNCRSEQTAEGNPGAPIVGLPDCERAVDQDDRGQVVWETLKAEGIPVPEHYDAPAFTGVEENLRLKLQAFRVGDVVLGSCACEAQVDLILNFESRANDVENDIYDGFDWACVAEDKGSNGFTTPDPDHVEACRLQREKYFDVAEFPTGVPGNNFAADAIARMRAQIHNDARGWDAVEYVPYANAEPADPKLIKGNFTKEELPASLGYKIAVGVGHAGDYNGYTVSYREYMSHDHYRKALTSYGAHTADYMATRLVRMAGAMKGAPELKPEPLDTLAQADEARMVAESTALGQVTKNAWEGYFAALPPDAAVVTPPQQPADIGLFKAATFSWTGGSTQFDNPRVVVQRKVDGIWKFFANQTGEVQTRVTWPTADQLPLVYAGQFEWRWTANFEAYEAFPARLGSTPVGTYKFVVEGCINDLTTAPDASLTARAVNLLAGLLPAAVAELAGIDAQACRGGATRYTLESDEFEVLGERELVAGATSDASGTLAITVAPTSIPKSYSSVFPYVSAANDNGRFCKECSFRPWATSTSTVTSVTVTVDATGQSFVATGSGATWSAVAGLADGASATIVATYADGTVSRAFAYTRQGSQEPGEPGEEPSEAPQLCAPEGTPEIEGECLKDNGGEPIQDAVDTVYGTLAGGL